MFYYAHAEVVVIAYVTYKTQIHIHVCAEVRVLDEQLKKKKKKPPDASSALLPLYCQRLKWFPVDVIPRITNIRRGTYTNFETVFVRFENAYITVIVHTNVQKAKLYDGET